MQSEILSIENSRSSHESSENDIGRTTESTSKMGNRLTRRMLECTTTLRVKDGLN